MNWRIMAAAALGMMAGWALAQGEWEWLLAALVLAGLAGWAIWDDEKPAT